MLPVYFIIYSVMNNVASGCDVNCAITPLSNFNDKKVTGYELWIETEFDSHAACASTCHLYRSCKTSGFSPSTGECRGYAVGFVRPELATTVNDPGFKLYPMCRATNFIGSGCVTDGDCEGANTKCLDGACACAAGYSFKKERPPLCVQSCPTYGSTFVAYEGLTVRFNNDRTISNNPTYEDCKLACVQEPSWVCKSFEYDKTSNQCNLQKKSWLQYSSFERNTNTDWVFFSRNCLI